MRWLYGHAVKHPDEQCAIRPEAPTRTICGREVGWLPTRDEDEPYTPTDLHDRCRDLIFGAVVSNPVPMPDTGVCPVCWGDVWLDAGMVAPHGAWLVRGDRTVVSETPCTGAGELPGGAQ
jgi:hypothetical protein